MQTVYSKKNDFIQCATENSAACVFDNSSQGESLQRKADMANGAAQRAETPRPNNTGLPDNLKSGIESLSGFSMDDVRVHYNSSKPATVQALAYTQGSDIHVAPGQEKHLPHEAWHVVLQMAGRVSPTTNINGMPVNDNAGLEHEADVMGEKAVQMVGDKSPKNKQSYGSVVQCKNFPVYFETKNNEGCENSRYYVNEDGYVRIAPINANRLPTQEYHEEKRNFVYVHNDKAIKFLKTYPILMKKIEETEYTKDIGTLIKEIGVAPSVNLELKNISRFPSLGRSPFDWNERSTHPGHPIAKVELYKDPEQHGENLSFYKKRKEFALEYAHKNKSFFRKQLKVYYNSLKLQLKTETNETKKKTLKKKLRKLKKCIDSKKSKKFMDEYFSLVWYKKIIESGSDGTKNFFEEREKMLE